MSAGQISSILHKSTELGPALARRSQWVSVPGAPLRATFSIALAPLARRGVHVSRSPGSVLGRRPPIRDGRFPLADRHSRYVACDRHTTLSAGGFGKPFPNPKPRHIPGLSSLFSCAVSSANCSPRQLSEASESHSVTPFVRFQTSGNGGFLCDTISSEIETGRSQ